LLFEKQPAFYQGKIICTECFRKETSNKDVAGISLSGIIATTFSLFELLELLKGIFSSLEFRPPKEKGRYRC
jgi:hypothetical protein